jgi:hypothetical protein
MLLRFLNGDGEIAQSHRLKTHFLRIRYFLSRSKRSHFCSSKLLITLFKAIASVVELQPEHQEMLMAR